MFKFRPQAFATLRTGLVHTKPARAAAVVSRRSGKEPRLLHAVSQGRVSGVLSWRATQSMLETLPAKSGNVSALLDSSDYQIVMTEGLDLPRHELRAAMRWRIRELVSFPVDDAVIDVFQMPAIRGNKNLIQVIAAQPTGINDLEAIVGGARRELDVVDIPELALRNLMALTPQDTSGCALILLGRSAVHIVVTCQGVLCVARRIDFALGSESGQLALELQRSMQYYESQFDRPPIGEVLIGPDNDRARELAPQIAAATGLNSSVLDIRSFLPCEPGIEYLNEPEVVLAIGAALRPSALGAGA